MILMYYMHSFIFLKNRNKQNTYVMVCEIHEDNVCDEEIIGITNYIHDYMTEKYVTDDAIIIYTYIRHLTKSVKNIILCNGDKNVREEAMELNKSDDKTTDIIKAYIFKNLFNKVPIITMLTDQEEPVYHIFVDKIPMDHLLTFY
jgi:hypothetical protein